MTAHPLDCPFCLASGAHPPDDLLRTIAAHLQVIHAEVAELRRTRGAADGVHSVIQAISAALPGETFGSADAFAVDAVRDVCRAAGIRSARSLGKRLCAAADRGQHGVVRVKRDRLGTLWAIEVA